MILDMSLAGKLNRRDRNWKIVGGSMRRNPPIAQTYVTVQLPVISFSSLKSYITIMYLEVAFLGGKKAWLSCCSLESVLYKANSNSDNTVQLFT